MVGKVLPELQENQANLRNVQETRKHGVSPVTFI